MKFCHAFDETTPNSAATRRGGCHEKDCLESCNCCETNHFSLSTYLFLLLVEVVDDDSDEEVEGEKGAEDDEEDKVEVHVDVHFANGLLADLSGNS
jgi:hypothetical protein